MADTHPNLPLTYNWGVGENVKTGMDQNLRLLGAVVQLQVLSRTQDQPGSPSEGNRYIVNGGTGWGGSENDVAVYLDGTWHYVTPVEGWQAWIVGEGARVEFKGGSWQVMQTGGGGANLPLQDGQDLFANATDNTKILRFLLDTIATGTTRVATWPDKDGTVAMLSDLTGGGIASDEFAEDGGTTSGLTWGWQAGSVRIGSTVYDISAGTVSLTDDATNYVYIDAATQTVEVNTSGFPSWGTMPIREVVTSGGSQSTSTDMRAWMAHPPLTDRLVDHGTVSSGTETVDYRQGRVHRITAGGDFTLAHSNFPAADVPADLEIVAINWGDHAVTLPGSWNWGSAGAPTFTSGGRDRIILRTDDGGTTVDAMLAGSGF